jgi:hypothetical protein
LALSCFGGADPYEVGDRLGAYLSWTAWRRDRRVFDQLGNGAFRWRMFSMAGGYRQQH